MGGKRGMKWKKIEGYVENIVFRNEENDTRLLHLSHPEWDE